VSVRSFAETPSGHLARHARGHGEIRTAETGQCQLLRSGDVERRRYRCKARRHIVVDEKRRPRAGANRRALPALRQRRVGAGYSYHEMLSAHVGSVRLRFKGCSDEPAPARQNLSEHLPILVYFDVARISSYDDRAAADRLSADARLILVRPVRKDIAARRQRRETEQNRRERN
jgi:hypothetical protein